MLYKVPKYLSSLTCICGVCMRTLDNFYRGLLLTHHQADLRRSALVTSLLYILMTNGGRVDVIDDRQSAEEIDSGLLLRELQ